MNDLFKHGAEFLRALTNHQYEVTNTGEFYFPRAQALVGGSLMHWKNGADMRVDNNTFTLEGLNYLLTTGMKNGTPVAAFYIAPFSGNVSPASSLTAATFNSVLTEATGYDEAARPEYVEGSAASGSISNTASRAEITASGVLSIWGAGILSVSTKSSTSGTCMAAAKFSAVRDLVASDVLAFDYTLTLTPT